MFLLAALLFLSPAHADIVNSTCPFPREVFPGTVTVAADYFENGDAYLGAETGLTVNGQNIPAVRACMFQDVPGRRGFRCPHRLGRTTFEVYPRFLTPNSRGRPNKVQIIIWENDKPRTVETKDCY